MQYKASMNNTSILWKVEITGMNGIVVGIAKRRGMEGRACEPKRPDL